MKLYKLKLKQMKNKSEKDKMLQIHLGCLKMTIKMIKLDVVPNRDVMTNGRAKFLMDQQKKRVKEKDLMKMTKELSNSLGIKKWTIMIHQVQCPFFVLKSLKISNGNLLDKISHQLKEKMKNSMEGLLRYMELAKKVTDH